MEGSNKMGGTEWKGEGIADDMKWLYVGELGEKTHSCGVGCGLVGKGRAKGCCWGGKGEVGRGRRGRAWCRMLGCGLERVGQNIWCRL